MTDQQTYATIAEAEAFLRASGFARDTNRHVWAGGGRAVKIVRTPDMKFIIQDA